MRSGGGGMARWGADRGQVLACVAGVGADLLCLHFWSANRPAQIRVGGGSMLWDHGFFRLDRPPQIWVGRFSDQNLRQIEILEQPAGGLHSPPQVPPVHITDAAFEEGEQLAQTRAKQRSYLKAVVKRRLGQPSEDCPPPRKRRGTKSYVFCMQLDNMLRHSAGKSLIDYEVPQEDGRIAGSPWTLPSLSLATDSGPDCASASFSNCFLEHPGPLAMSVRHWATISQGRRRLDIGHERRVRSPTPSLQNHYTRRQALGVSSRDCREATQHAGAFGRVDTSIGCVLALPLHQVDPS